jgi:hypothetical protein
MAHRTEGVVTLVVGEEEDDVRAWRRSGGVGSVEQVQGREQRQGGKKCENEFHAGGCFTVSVFDLLFLFGRIRL